MAASLAACPDHLSGSHSCTFVLCGAIAPVMFIYNMSIYLSEDSADLTSLPPLPRRGGGASNLLQTNHLPHRLWFFNGPAFRTLIIIGIYKKWMSACILCFTKLTFQSAYVLTQHSSKALLQSIYYYQNQKTLHLVLLRRGGELEGAAIIYQIFNPRLYRHFIIVIACGCY